MKKEQPFLPPNGGNYTLTASRTADGLPMIGPYDLAEGIYVSAGYNGGGFSWGVGRASLFIESRYFSVNANNVIGNRSRWVPIIIGVTFP